MAHSLDETCAIARLAIHYPSRGVTKCGTRYDTIYLRALKSGRQGQLNLAHGPKTKK